MGRPTLNVGDSMGWEPGASERTAVVVAGHQLWSLLPDSRYSVTSTSHSCCMPPHRDELRSLKLCVKINPWFFKLLCQEFFFLTAMRKGTNTEN